MQIGSWQIRPYTQRVVVGVVFALLWVWIMGPRRGFDRRRLIGLVWMLALGTLLIGRLGYVLENVHYFTDRPDDIVAVRQIGGLHGTGTWLGGALVLVMWAYFRGEAPFPLLRLMLPAALLVAAGAWWGCADAGCAWGQEALNAPSALQWLVVRAPDLYHTVRPRYVVQLLATLLALLMAGPAMLLPARSYLFGAGYGLGIAGLGLLRADPAVIIWGYRLDGWMHVGLAVCLIGLYFKDVMVDVQPVGIRKERR
jgi:prolipoprotein diacylglyceryltransferase